MLSMAAINPEVSKKFKNATKLTSRQEADGYEVKIDVREDEEQSVKLQEIIDILVAAGYFRARIKGLSPFDKVVGGITWCIESCRFDIDVDLLFQENSTIGQKIALTEKIVAVLPKIKCPHRIEPHQIQGLDFIHIFPVIQWLVKRSLEFREDISSSVRKYAVNQFEKTFKIEHTNAEDRKKVLDNINLVKEVYRPHRYYKRKNVPPHDISSRVQITLLEYDYRGASHARHSGSGKVNDAVGAGIQDDEFQEKKILSYLNDLTAAKEEVVVYDELDDEEKQKLSSHYAALQSELKDGGIQSREKVELSALEEEKRILTETCSKLSSAVVPIADELKHTNLLLQEIRLKQQEANEALKQLEDNETNAPGGLKEVEELVILSDNLKAQEIQFREQCKKELSKLQNLVEETKQTRSKAPTELNGNLNKDIEEETEKIRLLRLKLAKKNRHVAALQRQLDDVPNRSELSQYQNRFIELYNQVAAKHKETKQYYSLYNSLITTHSYMQKELSLLNSIADNYPEAMRSASGKEDFLLQFQDIVDKVRSSKLKEEQKVNQEKLKRDQLSNNLLALVELHRKYVTAVRQLSLECKKHETMLTQNAA